MLITHTPISLPVNTANQAVESLANEAINKPQIPASNPPDKSSQSKNSTEFAEQQKSAFQEALSKDKALEEKQGDGENKDGRGEHNGNPKDESAQLDLSEQKEVAELEARDREVKTHEQAHASVGGNLAGNPNFSYTTGPNGKRYATSGDVSIDISKVANDPAATIRKLEKVQRAALAPANPSGQDPKVAAAASAGVNQARAELVAKNIEESQEAKTFLDDKDKLDSKETDVESLKSDQSLSSDLNPIKAIRESNALNQKLQNSGAFDTETDKSLLSLTA